MYGNPVYVPIDEKHRLEACSPYGRTKLMIEDIFRDVAISDKEFHIILLRYFNPVGAHPSGTLPDGCAWSSSAISALCKAVIIKHGFNPEAQVACLCDTPPRGALYNDAQQLS